MSKPCRRQESHRVLQEQEAPSPGQPGVEGGGDGGHPGGDQGGRQRQAHTGHLDKLLQFQIILY